jgi:DNA polymerase-3 subunit epsilon
MKTGQHVRSFQRKKNLRRRMLATLLSLAFLPVFAIMAGVFFIANDYLSEIRKFSPSTQDYEHFNAVGIQLAFFLVIFAIIIATVAWRITDKFLGSILKIRHGAEIISRINLSHRIELGTGDELEELAFDFNHMAENLGKAYQELEERVREATQTVQGERNRLATVLRTMVDGVVVANEATETILMNPRARIILDMGYSSGIGTALGRMFPSDRLNFHVNKLRKSWGHGREPVEDVVFPIKNGKLLVGSLSIIPGTDGEPAGFLLVFRNLSTRRIEETLQEMPQLLRGPLATSRSLIETLQRHRDMSAEKHLRFLAAVAEEMNLLSERVIALEETTSSTDTSRWPAIPSNPRELLEEAVSLVPQIHVEIESDDAPVSSVLVEPFSWVASLQCVLLWIQQMKPGQLSIAANLRVEDGTVVTTFLIKGPFNGTSSELETLEICPAGEPTLPLMEAVHKNRGELWIRSSGDFHEVRLALLQAVSVSEGHRTNGLFDGEPEFYDFDLFLPRPVIERADQLQAELTELDYVVFDTETTGTRISQGDKAISLSGVRIRRGRIQNAEIFHTLINPGRSIPEESILFHHIEDDMVADAPTISQVYPQFVEFVGDSILVAHNAAFDMKCLEIAASEAGLPLLDNPILDTLLLSYGIHEGAERHSLEAMTERMGITIVGRHTSLGDARATAQVFLGLLSLLPARGVRTLAEAKGFCDRQLLLRWQSSRY